MTDRRNVLPGDKLSEGEMDSLFDGFTKMTENPDICQLEEIDITKAGWQVILHFDDKDPRRVSSAAAKDFWKLEEWSAIGMFEMDCQRSPNTVVTLKFDENCGSDKFSAEQIALFKKYRPLASAPATSRLTDQTKEKIEAALGAEAVGEDDGYELVDPDDDGVELLEGDALNKMVELDFDLLILRVAGDREDLEVVLAKLQEISAEEELVMEVDRTCEPLEIYISKKEEVMYRKTLDTESFSYLKQFEFTLV